MARQYSFQTGEKNSFHVLDYVIFVGTLVFSASIGIFYAVKDRKRNNVKEFLLAGGNMHVLPVTMSLLASFMSAITLLGTPAEMYNHTTVYMWIGVSYIFAMGLAAHVYIPVFYNLKITSAYEYLEKRFSKGVKILGTLVFSLQMIIYMAIVLYGPSLALSAVTGLSLWGAVASVGLVCTFYTALGGMKAVLWTDTFQVVMMITGLLASLIQGSIEIGGFQKAWKIAEANQRVVFNEFSFDPTIRHTFWSLTIGGTFLWLSIYGSNQAQVQRALTCSSLRDAQIALWINCPGLAIILVLCSLIGIVMYAFYSTCDPMSYGLVYASDQLFPLFVLDVLGHVPGIPGLFVACIFSGSLSSLSSGLNSLAAVILQDILKPCFVNGLTEERATRYSKILAVSFGLICLCLTWVASQLGGILQAGLSLMGILGAPMLGLFTLGMIFPWANTWGAFTGLTSSVLFMFWIGIGKYVVKVPSKRSPISVAGCNWNLTSHSMLLNVTSSTSFYNVSDFITMATNISKKTPEVEGLTKLYTVSYMWYSLIAVIIVVVVGLTVSFATGRQDPSKLDPRLICPIVDVFCPCLPQRFRYTCRCRVSNDQVCDLQREEKLKQKGPQEEFSPEELSVFLEKEININEANGNSKGLDSVQECNSRV